MLRLASCLLVLSWSGDTAPERIVLQGGAVLETVVLDEDDASLRVDLGFGELEIPASAILERGPAGLVPAVDAVSDGDDPYRGRLYREDGAPEPRSFDENVREVGEAVVLVRSPVGLGSGFVVHEEGYLITNNHVIAGTNELTVIVYRQATDGLRKDEYKRIRIVATSELMDLALLKIEPDEPETFVSVPLGDSNKLIQGETVFAVGNPHGLERTLTEGIIAVRARLFAGGQTYVQTTAPISPGNSGGPLFNMRGQVVGVNTLKIASVASEGLGFSIPVNRVKDFLDNQEAYAFDPLNANTGFRYYAPPTAPETDAAGGDGS